jgi:GTP cyclohydrolase I
MEQLTPEKKISYDYFKAAAESIIAGLNVLGFDDPDNFEDTPARVARAYLEIFNGVIDTDNQVQQILSTAFPSEGHNDMIVASGITVFSMCPHHLLPVEYKIAVGYVPNKNGKVLGLSKLVRLVEALAKRPVLQETLAQDIIKALETIHPEGAGVSINGRHLCMRMRGVKSVDSSVKTSAVVGCFKEYPACRQEFINNTRVELEF